MQYFIPIIRVGIFICLLFYNSYNSFSQAGELVANKSNSTSAYYGFYQYLPEDYDNSTSEEHPLLIFLHGYGERGNGNSDLGKLLRNGPTMLIDKGKWPDERPFIVLAPQSGNGFFSLNGLKGMIDYAISNYRVDESRIYLTGLSAGGISIWNHIANLKDKVAAAVPIAGNGNTPWRNEGCKLSNIPIWAFHGDADKTVNPGGSINPIKQIKECAGQPEGIAKITIYPGVGHNSWGKTYDLSGMTQNVDNNYDPFDISIYDWLLSFKLGNSQPSNLLPNVVINKPSNNQIFTISEKITIEASAGDSDGSVSKVEFYMNNTLLGEKANAPYVFNINSATIGKHTIYAKAYDNKNAVKKSSVINIEVKDNENIFPSVDIIKPSANHNFQLGDQVLVECQAKDSDGSIAKVELFANNQLKSTISKSPYKFDLGNLPVGEYELFAKAYDDDNASTKSPSVRIFIEEPEDKTPPSAPQNLNGVLSFNKIEINWSASTDNVKVEGYEVYLNNALTAKVNKLQYEFSGLSENTNYYIKVRAFDAENNYSSFTSVNLMTRLISPSELKGEFSESSSHVQLQWQYNSNNESEFIIERSINQRFEPKNSFEISENTSSYKDLSVESNKTYFYKIKAINENNDSEYSNIVQINTSLNPPDNNVPVLNQLNNITIKEGEILKLNLEASDGDNEQLTFSIKNVLSFLKITDIDNNSALLEIKPSFDDANIYNVMINVTDPNGAEDSTSFTITVQDVVKQSYSINININEEYPEPGWNNTNSKCEEHKKINNLIDSKGNPTNISMQILDGWYGQDSNGMYEDGKYIPKDVMRTFYFVKDDTAQIKFLNLDPDMLYDFMFFASRASKGARTTYYQINQRKVRLNASYNVSDSVVLNDIKPNENGEVNIKVYKDLLSWWGYLNAIKINAKEDINANRVLSDTLVNNENQQHLSHQEVYSFEIYPNPVENFINVRFTGLKVDEAQVIIRDKEGNVLFDEHLKGDGMRPELYIDISDLNLLRDVYILDIDAGVNQDAIRFIKN